MSDPIDALVEPSWMVPGHNKVPYVFTWKYGGDNVYLIGSFTDWSDQIKLVKSGQDFTAVAYLERGKSHAYRYIVENESRLAQGELSVPRHRPGYRTGCGWSVE